jgi:hypothetical protein
MEAFRTFSMFDWFLDEHSMYDDAFISFESFFASWELMQELELDSLKSDFVPETNKKLEHHPIISNWDNFYSSLSHKVFKQE